MTGRIELKNLQPMSLVRGLAVPARLPAVVLAAVLGVFVLYGVGFAPIGVVHNAAHDGRHVFSLPCH